MRGAWAASAAATISAIIRPPVGPNGITAERCCQGGGSDATRLLRDAAAPDYFLRLLPKLRGFDMLKVDPAMPDAEVTLEYLCDNIIWIVGSPDTVARKLATLSGDVGGFGHAPRHRARVDAARHVGALDAPAGRGGRAAAQPRGICEIPGSRPRKFPLTAPSTTRSWPLT